MTETLNINSVISNDPAEFAGLDFLWLEITSRCNLECVHCYADSSPNPTQTDILTPEHYFNLLDEAAELGCTKVQFIGGEPTTVKELPDLIRFAKQKKFEFVEVFTNGVALNNDLIDCFVENQVNVATSFYSNQSRIHDAITARNGSFLRTSEALKRLVSRGVDVRVGIIAMQENAGQVENTKRYLQEIGISHIGVDRLRSFGRGVRSEIGRSMSMNELCGSCWQGSLCVFPDGNAAPCIMSRNWPVGSVLKNSLREIVNSARLRGARAEIYNDIWLPITANCSPLSSVQSLDQTGRHHTDGAADCWPDQCQPECAPNCSPSCSPCYPYGKCNPDLYGSPQKPKK